MTRCTRCHRPCEVVLVENEETSEHFGQVRVTGYTAEESRCCGAEVSPAAVLPGYDEWADDLALTPEEVDNLAEWCSAIERMERGAA